MMIGRTSSSSVLRCQGIDLRDVDLSHMDLQNINMKNADLRHCNLTGANLINCCLERANMEGAILDVSLSHFLMCNSAHLSFTL